MRTVTVRVLVQNDQFLNDQDPSGLTPTGYLALTETMSRLGTVLDITASGKPTAVPEHIAETLSA